MRDDYIAALSLCEFVQTGDRWEKQLAYQDDSKYTLFQLEGRSTWSVDITKENVTKTEPAKKMKGAPVYTSIEAEIQAIDEAMDKLKNAPIEQTEDPLENLKEGGFEFEPEVYPIESFEEPEDIQRSRITLSDSELIQKINTILSTPGPSDTTLRVKL